MFIYTVYTSTSTPYVTMATVRGGHSVIPIRHFSIQPRPQGLLAFQYGGGRREDPGTQQKSRD